MSRAVRLTREGNSTDPDFYDPARIAKEGKQDAEIYDSEGNKLSEHPSIYWVNLRTGVAELMCRDANGKPINDASGERHKTEIKQFPAPLEIR